MKSILISIKPKYVAEILNGNKTIEIRKTMPKCDLPIDVYIYCTKDNKHKLEYCDYNGGCWSANDGGDYFNGKVVAKFTLNNVDKLFQAGTYFERYEDGKIILKNACLNIWDFEEYRKDKSVYAWHIDNLVIFNKPKELCEFKHYNKPSCESCPFVDSANCDYHREVECDDIPLTKTPQSWCYVDVEEEQ